MPVLPMHSCEKIIHWDNYLEHSPARRGSDVRWMAGEKLLSGLVKLQSLPEELTIMDFMMTFLSQQWQ
ncbi:hypothetical protein CHARACLAT_033228 [Characodon lateralis]|uniref:Uncharacterized protein n=1 Tax=Characodon lateralis TaxID=208331 RepID=A0ABU7DW96_9TELE|nr:hypothetical protein [Characodon lateralis]